MIINQDGGKLYKVTGKHGLVIHNDALDVNHVNSHGIVKRFLVQYLLFVMDVEIGFDGFVVISVETYSLFQEISVYIGGVFAQIQFHLGVLLGIP